jgi:hypothetical protein
VKYAKKAGASKDDTMGTQGTSPPTVNEGVDCEHTSSVPIAELQS